MCACKETDMRESPNAKCRVVAEKLATLSSFKSPFPRYLNALYNVYGLYAEDLKIENMGCRVFIILRMQACVGYVDQFRDNLECKSLLRILYHHVVSCLLQVNEGRNNFCRYGAPDS
jgi:hypothetical protein